MKSPKTVCRRSGTHLASLLLPGSREQGLVQVWLPLTLPTPLRGVGCSLLSDILYLDFPFRALTQTWAWETPGGTGD